MEILLDSAKITEIKQAIDLFDVVGVTTNPSIIAKEKGKYFDILMKIRDELNGRCLHVQVLSKEANQIVKEALYIVEKLDYKNLYIKVPVTPEGLKAMRKLKELEINVTATGIITTEQIILASKYADYAAPYVNRIENIGGTSNNVISNASRIVKEDVKILGASYKNIGQITNSIIAGAQSITVPFELLKQMSYHPYTDWSIDKFDDDFRNQFEGANSILDL